MATIKVPYTYKEYPYSKKATFISKHTHKPDSCFLISTILLIIPGALGIIIYNATGQEIESVGGAIASVILLLTFVAFIVLPMLIPKISDHFDWAGKIAQKDLQAYVSDPNYWFCKCGIRHRKDKELCYSCKMRFSDVASTKDQNDKPA